MEGKKHLSSTAGGRRAQLAGGQETSLERSGWPLGIGQEASLAPRGSPAGTARGRPNNLSRREGGRRVRLTEGQTISRDARVAAGHGSQKAK